MALPSQGQDQGVEEGRKSCFLSKKQEIADMLISMKEHTSPKGLQDLRREIQSQVLLLDRKKEMQLKSRYRSVFGIAHEPAEME